MSNSTTRISPVINVDEILAIKEICKNIEENIQSAQKSKVDTENVSEADSKQDKGHKKTDSIINLVPIIGSDEKEDSVGAMIKLSGRRHGEGDQ